MRGAQSNTIDGAKHISLSSQKYMHLHTKRNFPNKAKKKEDN